MAFSFFLNFEKLSINIVNKSLSEMTDSNLDSNGDVDDVMLENNIYHGVIAAVFSVNLYETALNTISPAES